MGILRNSVDNHKLVVKGITPEMTKVTMSDMVDEKIDVSAMGIANISGESVGYVIFTHDHAVKWSFVGTAIMNIISEICNDMQTSFIELDEPETVNVVEKTTKSKRKVITFE